MVYLGEVDPKKLVDAYTIVISEGKPKAPPEPYLFQYLVRYSEAQRQYEYVLQLACWLFVSAVCWGWASPDPKIIAKGVFIYLMLEVGFRGLISWVRKRALEAAILRGPPA